MNIRELLAAGADLSRKPNSRWSVSLHYIPGGYDYVNAKIIVGFWPDELREVAEAFAKRNAMPPEMAHIIDLHDPRYAELLQPKHCVHCKKPVNFHSAGYYVSDDVTLPQYCWVDPDHGSQPHEV